MCQTTIRQLLVLKLGNSLYYYVPELRNSLRGNKTPSIQSIQKSSFPNNWKRREEENSSQTLRSVIRYGLMRSLAIEIHRLRDVNPFVYDVTT